MEAAVDRNGKHLQKYGNKYQCNTKFYQKLKFLATEVSELPESLRQKAKDFIGQYSALDTSPVNRVGCDSK